MRLKDFAGLALACVASVATGNVAAYSWTMTAPMAAPQYSSQATLLRSGKVLVVGGLLCCSGGYGNPYTNPQTFDPVAGTWTASPSSQALTLHSVTRLNSGKVLVAGGWGPGSSGYAISAAAMLYDPATDSWTNTGPLNRPHASHSATLLDSGKVLIAGGYSTDFTQSDASAELYDPASNTWTLTGSLSAARADHTATLLKSGKVLVAGGMQGGVAQPSAELFDPQTRTWQAAATMLHGTYGAAAAMLRSGKVLVAAGFNGGFLADAQIYDPKANAWLAAASMQGARTYASATLLPNGKVLVIGGENQVQTGPTSYAGVTLATTELYDAQANSWTASASLNEARMQHSATLLRSGAVLVTGGANAGSFQASSELLATGMPAVYTPLVPSRLLDTRAGQATCDGDAIGSGALGPQARMDLQVTNRCGVPAAGVAAVVLNVTAAAPSAAGFLTVWPSDETRPTASNLNFMPGDIVPNLVVAKVGADGKVAFFNSAGGTHVIADVVGWFPVTSGVQAFSPARLLDTRAGRPTMDGLFAGSGTLAADATLDLAVTGRAQVAYAAAGSAMLNTTATDTSADGFLTLWPQGSARPLASNLNFAPSQTIPNLAVSQIAVSGEVSIYNSQGATNVIADLVGWLPASSEFNAVAPSRLLDTRAGGVTVDGLYAATGALSAAGTLALKVSGRAGLPSDGVGAVVVNLTATQPTAPAYLTVWQNGSPQPNASNLNFLPAQTRANLVIAPVGADGKIAIYNSAGSTEVTADIVGWFPLAQ